MEDEDRKFLYALNALWFKANEICIDKEDAKACRVRDILDRKIDEVEKRLESRRVK